MSNKKSNVPYVLGKDTAHRFCGVVYAPFEIAHDIRKEGRKEWEARRAPMRPKTKVEGSQLQCQRCNHQWKGSSTCQRCPNCKSAYWDADRVLVYGETD